MIVVGPLAEADRTRWAELWREYLTFYQTTLQDDVFDATWARLRNNEGVFGLAARDGDAILGITHFLYHPSCWTLAPVCYLQDLFTDSAARNRGVARALITAVAAHARAVGSPRLYWLTQSHNETARALYDRVAKHTGFIRYEYAL